LPRGHNSVEFLVSAHGLVGRLDLEFNTPCSVDFEPNCLPAAMDRCAAKCGNTPYMEVRKIQR
jgi:hypothetical protein